MGNCLALQEKFVRVMKTDGKILEYQAPLKVHQVLSEYPGHAISQTLPGTQHLRPDSKLRAGQLYYLVPVPVPSVKLDKEYSKRKVVAGKENHGVVRIKLLIGKQDLEEMLSKGEIEDMIWTVMLVKILKGGNQYFQVYLKLDSRVPVLSTS